MQTGARLHEIGNDHAESKRQRRECQEIEHRLAGDAADLLQVRHAGNAGRDRQEDYGSNDHLDQFDESIAERLQSGSEIRIEMTDKHAGADGDDHLEIEMSVKWFRLARSHGGRRNVHDFLLMHPNRKTGSSRGDLL